MRRTVFLCVFVAFSLVVSACSQGSTLAEPLRDMDGELIDPSTSPTPAPATTTSAPEALALGESDVEGDDTSAPDPVPAGATDPLCADIDQTIEISLTGDPSALDSLVEPDSIVSRHVPAELLTSSGGILPAGGGFMERNVWDDLDAFTEERCGLPFFTAVLSTMSVCDREMAEAISSVFNPGPCLDPRQNPDVIFDDAEIDTLLALMGLGESVQEANGN